MNSCFPVAIEVPMTFAAQPVTFRKVDPFASKEAELIAIRRVVAVEAPHEIGVMEFDIGMFFFDLPLGLIHLHGGMTVAAGEVSFCDRRRSDWELLNSHGRTDETTNQTENEQDCNAYLLHVVINSFLASSFIKSKTIFGELD